MDKLVLGIDVAAHRTRAALSTEAQIVGELTEPTRQGSTREVLAQIVGLAARLMSQVGKPGSSLRTAVAAIGVSVPTFINPGTGELGMSPNVPGLAGQDVTAPLRAGFGVPVIVDNDANMAALAEGRHGAAAGCRNYVVVLLGHGLGMGIVVDGKLVHGWRGRAGEIGHLPLGLSPGAKLGNGDYEASVTEDGLRARLRRAAADNSSSVLRTAKGIEDALRAAQNGDAAAGRAIQEEARLVALGLASVVAVLDPEMIILCGEIGALTGFAEPVRDALEPLVGEPRPTVKAGSLGQRAELLGALEAARSLAAAPPAVESSEVT